MTPFNDPWTVAESVLPHVTRMLLYGPPGTGKTSLGYFTSHPGGEPNFFPCHEEASVAEFIGHFIPVGDRFVWLDGPGLDAWRYGKRLIIDEIDLASGALLSILRAVLNDPGIARITIPDPNLASASDTELADAITHGRGLETIAPASGFQVLATMNGEPSTLDEPLLDRFEAQLFIPEPHPNAIASLPEDLRAVCTKTAKESDERRIGVRKWKSFANLRTSTDEQTALAAVFGPRAKDVSDALNLARKESKPEPKIEPTKVEPPKAKSEAHTDALEGSGAYAGCKCSLCEAIRSAAAGKPLDELDAPKFVPVAKTPKPISAGETIPEADRPRTYWHTGKRGRPARIQDGLGRNLRRADAIETDSGLYMRGDGTLLAETGKYSIHELVGKDETGKPISKRIK